MSKADDLELLEQNIDESIEDKKTDVDDGNAKKNPDSIMDIGIRLRIDEVTEVSTSEQKYTVRGVFEKDWPASSEDLENYRKFLNKECNSYEPTNQPPLSWINCVDYPIFNQLEWSETRCKYRIENGRNQTRFDMLSTWTEQFEVESFPFDVQDLTMVFCSEDSPCNKTIITSTAGQYQSLEVDKTWSPITHFEINNVDINYEKVDFGQKGLLEQTYIYARYRIQVKRKWKGILYRIIIWMFMLGLLSWTTFGIDYQSIGDRMGFSMTMVLTVVAFQFVIANELPNVNYLTFLDKYNLFIFVYVVLICFEAVIIGWHGKGIDIQCMQYINDNKDNECHIFYAEYYDNILAVLFACFYILGNITFICYAIYLHRIENEKIGHWDKYKLEILKSNEK